MNSLMLSIPRNRRMQLRTAASRRTARQPRRHMEANLVHRNSVENLLGLRIERQTWQIFSGQVLRRWTISFSFIFRRAAVSPKIVRMLSSPSPRTSR